MSGVRFPSSPRHVLPGHGWCAGRADEADRVPGAHQVHRLANAGRRNVIRAALAGNYDSPGASRPAAAHRCRTGPDDAGCAGCRAGGASRHRPRQPPRRLPATGRRNRRAPGSAATRHPRVSRRQVRVDPTFFDRLDELFAPERGSDGTPSATDFLLHDLPVVIDLLAEDYFGHTTVVAADPEIRVSITAGLLRAVHLGVRRARRGRRRRDLLTVRAGRDLRHRTGPSRIAEWSAVSLRTEQCCCVCVGVAGDRLRAE